MNETYLEAGKIVSTHGIKGEVKVLPWADSPEFLTRFKTFYLAKPSPSGEGGPRSGSDEGFCNLCNSPFLYCSNFDGEIIESDIYTNGQ